MPATSLYRPQAMPAQIVTGQDFTPDLFREFVTWLDRSEQTTRSYLTNLRQFFAWLTFQGIRNPTRADIIRYREWLQSEHEAIRLTHTGWSYRTDSFGKPIRISCTATTTAQYVRSVCQFFKWTAAAGRYPNIAENIHPPQVQYEGHKKDALTIRQAQTVEASILENTVKGQTQHSEEQGKRLYAMYLLAVYAGLRTVELSRANVKDLETKDGSTVLYVWGKGRSEADQKKPLAPEVAAAIRDYLKTRPGHLTGASPLFASTGNRSGGQRIAATTISKMLKRAMQDAGFDSARLTAHSLRHTCGTIVMDLTGNLYQAQTYMRHRSPATTEIYLHTNVEKQDAQTAQLLYNALHDQTGS